MAQLIKEQKSRERNKRMARLIKEQKSNRFDIRTQNIKFINLSKILSESETVDKDIRLNIENGISNSEFSCGTNTMSLIPIGDILYIVEDLDIEEEDGYNMVELNKFIAALKAIPNDVLVDLES